MKVLTIRLDDDTHARAVEAAERDSRSLNGQLNWLIRAGLGASRPVVELHYEYKSGNDEIAPADAKAAEALTRRRAAREATVGYSKERQTGKGKR